MTTTTQLTTAEELLGIPGNEKRYELLKGEIRVMEPAGFEHGKITMNISIPLGHYVQSNSLGVLCAAETGFKISSDPDTVRAPDVAFVSNEQIHRIGSPKGFWPGAPDLAVEVISPGDNYTEVEEKVFDWLEAGTRMIVVVHPRRHAVTVYRSFQDITMLTESDTLNGGDVIPGWSMAVREIFR